MSITVNVIVILQKEDQVFLFKRKNTDWADGYYTVPSGHVDIGETPIMAAIREAKEETGVTIASENLRAVHTDFIEGEVINFTFLATDWDGEAKIMEQDKAEDGKWFSLDDLPDKIAGHGKTILEDVKNGVTYYESK